jgi:hypothetical protein
MSKDAVVQLLGRTRPKVDPAIVRPPQYRTSSAESLWRLRAMLDRPEVVPIYWDKHFRRTPADVSAFNELLRTLFASSWMSELGAYGVKPARLLPAIVPADTAPARLRQAELESRMRSWVRTDPSRRSKASPVRSPVYLVVTPLRTELAFDRHAAARLDSSLNYVVVPLKSTSGEILDSHALTISRDLARALIAETRRSLD